MHTPLRVFDFQTVLDPSQDAGDWITGRELLMRLGIHPSAAEISANEETGVLYIRATLRTGRVNHVRTKQLWEKTI